MLLTEEVEIILHNKTIKHYEDLGYEIPRRKDNQGRLKIAKGTKIKVKIKDLQDGSNVCVDISCDCCNEIIFPSTRWYSYKKNIKKDSKYYCQKCAKNGYKKYISFYDWCYQNLSKEEADIIILRWDYELNIDKNGNKLTPKNISFSSHGFNKKGYWFKCLEHLEHKSEQKNISNFTGSNGSINCIQCNAIKTIYPQIIELLVNMEDADKSKGTGEKILMKCPKCDEEKYIKINNFIKQGFGCHKCSDGISYPNKFMFNFFEQIQKLNKIKNFKREQTFKWLKYQFKGKLRQGFIDFYFELNNKKYGIEMDGEFHIKDNSMNGQTKEESKYIDNEKDILLKKYAIEPIRIDCRKSEMEWIKNHIMQSNPSLPQLLNFKVNDIDWIKCHEYACNSLVKIACDLWNNEIKIVEIAGILKVHRNTIVRYLKQGTIIGWCNYIPEKEKEKNFMLIHKNNNKKIINLTTMEVFNSINEASNKYNMHSSNISTCCHKKQKSAGKHPITGEPLVWMYYEDYIKTQNKSA